MRISLLILTLLSFSNKLQAQNLFAYPQPSGHTYYDFQACDSLHLRACGMSGTFVYSNDGGSTWSSTFLPTLADLQALSFPHPDTGFVAGSTEAGYQDPTILRTHDGGLTWDSLNSLWLRDYYDIHFINATTGWVCGSGGVVLKTNDGGQSWSTIQTSVNQDLLCLYFIDADTGFVAGNNGALLKTVDAGNSWQSLFSGTSADIHTLFFHNSMHGFYAGEFETIKESQDGGITWINRYFTAQSPVITSMVFTDSLRGYAVSEPYIYYTVNGGQNWSDANNFFHNKTTLAFASPSTVWTAGYFGSLQVSTDTAQNFVSVAAEQNYGSLDAISFATPWSAWSCGENGVLMQSVDGGQNWQRKTNISFSRGFDIAFTDSLNGWMSANQGKVYRTQNGGQNWSNLTVAGAGTELRGIYFLNSNVGWVVGASSSVYKTINGGTSWSAVTVSPSFVFMWDAIEFVSPDTGWIVGWQGQAYRTVNGGNNWTQMNIDPFTDFYSMRFLDKDTGYVGGANGKIFKTTDGGLSWTELIQLCAFPLQGMDFYDGQHGIAFGGEANYGCKAYYTSDGGQNWVNMNLPFAYDGKDVLMTDTVSAWLIGDFQAILRVGNPVSLPTSLFENSGSEDYGLELIPNPANQSLTLNWRSDLRPGAIELMSITGAVIKRIEPGLINSLTINLNEYAAGMYLIRISSESTFASQTKKLLIVR